MKNRFNRRPDIRVVAASLALMLGAVGCGSDNSVSSQSKAPQERAGPSGQNGPELAKSIAKISLAVRGEQTVPSTFCKNTDSNPQRYV